MGWVGVWCGVVWCVVWCVVVVEGEILALLYDVCVTESGWQNTWESDSWRPLPPWDSTSSWTEPENAAFPLRKVLLLRP